MQQKTIYIRIYTDIYNEIYILKYNIAFKAFFVYKIEDKGKFGSGKMEKQKLKFLNSTFPKKYGGKRWKKEN